MNTDTNRITIQTTVHAPIARVWSYWTSPAHITQWNAASDDWHTPTSENDLRTGGRFVSRMEAKDGSFGFDFGGTYDDVQIERLLLYTMDDGRKVSVTFESRGDQTKVVESLEPEATNSLELQRTGLQAILDNFKKYVEMNG